MTSQKPTKEQVQHRFWLNAQLEHKLHDAQKEMYSVLNGSTNSIFVMNCSRQIGKSYFLCTFALEYALRNPGAKICYLAPQARMVKKIIIPRIRALLKDCPADLKPQYKVYEQVYYFKNGSEIHIAGTDNERAENLRGQVFHLVICDEAGFMDDLDYVVTSILMPMISTTKGRIILSSTPPISPDHAFVRYVQQAEAGGYYIKKTIKDNPLVSDEMREELCRLAGGEQSDAWRREYLAEFVTSQEDAILPEATEEQMAKLIQIWQRPLFYDSYVSVDLGYTDNTGILFGYWDFLRNKLIIEDESLFNKPNSSKIAEVVKGKEKELWEMNNTIKEPFKRIIDGNDITISDLNSPPHFLRFVKTRNDDLLAAVNEVRIMLQNEQIIINPRCKTLISQMKYGIWDRNGDSKRKKFARSEGQGHFDLLASLIYMVRNIARHKNPYPPGLGLDINTMYIGPDVNRRNSDQVNQLKKVFLNPVKKFFGPDKA